MLSELITLEIKGYNGAELLQKLTKEGVKVKKVRKIDKKTMLLTVSAKESKKTFAICERMWYNYNVVSRFGVRQTLNKAIKRCGLALGAIVCVLVAFYCSNILAVITVNGNEKVSREEILTALDGAGVNLGDSVSAIDKDKVYGALVGIDGIAEASVEVVGNTLSLTVMEKDDKAVGVDSGSVIVSDFDGVITSISCVSGTAKVRVGQVVKKGDVLIEGVTYDQQGEVLESVTASGEVKGVVSNKSEVVTSLITGSYERTGKQKKSIVLTFLGLKVGKSVNPFTSYESETASETLTMFPVKVEQTVYFETVFKQSERTLEEIVKELEEKAKLEAGADAQIKIRTEKQAEKVYKIITVSQAERKISKPQ